MFRTFFIIALLILASHESFAAVRGSGDVSAYAGGINVPVGAAPVMDAETTMLVRQLDTMLTARFDAAGRIASVPARRQALEELSAFAKMTVEGLIGAAPSADARASIFENLEALLAWHQDEILAALAALPRAAR
ncbi:MAG: hypothetical protein IT566_02935 [Rhodospirillaceae bacterium]|nr:hypothetical protein [Rhodospirillaceae bacterium]